MAYLNDDMVYLEGNGTFEKAVRDANPVTLLGYSKWQEAAGFTLRQGALPFERSPEFLTVYDNIWLQLFGPNSSVSMSYKIENRIYCEPKYPYSGGLTPRDLHHRSGHDAIWASFHIMPSPAFVAQCAREIGRGDPDCMRFQFVFRFEDPLVTQLCLALYHEQCMKTPGGAVYVGSLLHTLTTRLLLTASPLLPQPSLPTLRTTGLTTHEVRTIQAYIDGNLDQALTLPDLANTLQMSVTQFRRRFKHTLHVPPHQYLIQRRVERATELLRSGVYSVAQVAHAVGFTDQSHLYRHCKRILGVKPSDMLPSDQNVQRFDWFVQDRTSDNR